MVVLLNTAKAQGHVLDNVEKIDPSLHYLEPPLLAMNRGSRFEPADAGTRAVLAARGTAFGDLNDDGSIDVVTICWEVHSRSS